MSFNLGGFFTERSEHHGWTHRAPLVVDLLRARTPDLLATQEVQRGNMPELHRALSGYAGFCGKATCARPSSAEAVYNIVFWRRGRFRRLSAGSFFLSETPNTWSRGWGATHVRGATWVQLKCCETGRTILVCSVHLDHRSRSAREEGSRLVITRLGAVCRGRTGTLVVAGDFNSRAWAPPNEDAAAYLPPVLPEYLPEGGPVHDLFTSSGFKDAFLEVGGVDGLGTNTYHDFLGEHFPPVALRIDWILYKDEADQLGPRQLQVVREPRSDTFPSDHYPIIAQFSWEN